MAYLFGTDVGGDSCPLVVAPHLVLDVIKLDGASSREPSAHAQHDEGGVDVLK